MEDQKSVILNYIESYNAFDVNGMVEHLHEDIVFENSTNGEVDLTTKGLEQFKVQAHKAKNIFSSRKQTIKSWNFEGDKVIIEINYEGTLAIDLPGSAQKGDTLELYGTSEFLFKNGKIVSIHDKS